MAAVSRDLDAVRWEAITPEMRDLLRFIGQQPFAARFYLAGGTALALRLGHRRSIDLDFFSGENLVLAPARRSILRAMAPTSPQVVENVDGDLLLRLPHLHVAFLSYRYRLLGPTETVEGVAVASLVDVGLMKLDALVGRGSRKDFYDLYFLARQLPIRTLLELSETKYPGMRDFPLMAVESMVLFENADRDLTPDLLIDVAWPEVREFFVAQAKDLGREWFASEMPD